MNSDEGHAPQGGMPMDERGDQEECGRCGGRWMVGRVESVFRIREEDGTLRMIVNRRTMCEDCRSGVYGNDVLGGPPPPNGTCNWCRDKDCVYSLTISHEGTCPRTGSGWEDIVCVGICEECKVNSFGQTQHLIRLSLLAEVRNSEDQRAN